MDKQSGLVGLAGKAVGFTAGSVLPKALTAGYKGLVRPVARMALKHPGMAIVGATMPSMVGGYMNTAGQKGLSSLPRRLPKFASAGRDALHASRGIMNDVCPTNKQGEEMSDKKYPSVFYQIEGFEKMAASAEAAHRLVKKAFVKDVLKSIFGFGQPSLGSAIKSEMAKNLAKGLAEPGENVAGLIAAHKDKVTQIANELRPKSIREVFGRLRGVSPLGGALAIGLPAYYFGHKAYKDYQENKALEGSFSNMLSIYPELQNENPQNTRQYFDYIKQYSPTVAKNPHAAGAIVKRFASTGGMAMDSSVIKSLLEVEKVKSEAGRGHQGILGTLGAMI